MRKLSNGEGIDGNVSTMPTLREVDGTSQKPATQESSENASRNQDDANMNTSSEEGSEDGKQGIGLETSIGDKPKPMSKNQLKKLKRDELWEAGREQRKAKRRQKNKEKRERKRAARGQEHNSSGNAEGKEHELDQNVQRKHHTFRPTLLPVTLLLDCQFNDLMNSYELISLGAQLTRCYSDNYRSPFKAQLVISSWGGSLKKRFDTVLSRQYEKWKGVKFTSKSFLEAAQDAREIMKSSSGRTLVGAFASYNKKDQPLMTKGEDFPTTVPEANNTTATAVEPAASHSSPISEAPSTALPPLGTPGEIIYLTSDSPYTLKHLTPYSTYIIGGLVDKNRHKGICYRIARDAGADVVPSSSHNGTTGDYNDNSAAEANKPILRTAKLPIGEYMSMQSRTVLTTNHVCEIMIRWLECGDWGEAFTRVLPKRKGATLKGKTENEDDAGTLHNDTTGEDDALKDTANNARETNEPLPSVSQVDRITDERQERDQEIMELVTEESENLFQENKP
ncbi:putative trna m g methyltransferase domain containing protein [Phaeomoniella chlamydospora]|uniref:tRNA (guanine(9)-N1)-methyltransferase n=1 Tax=Phaeomoniella chlamydospora TaxID=158046 RepID=A0A0G2ELJ7_PHACM|nr:putative trna m g methyltransferase domain containing protein [Phaeomoniella chlamydospora]